MAGMNSSVIPAAAGTYSGAQAERVEELMSMGEKDAMFLFESCRGDVAAFAAGELGECFVDSYIPAASRESLLGVLPVPMSSPPWVFLSI